MTIPKETLRQVRRLQIRTSRDVNAILTGSWHSAFKGRGMEFEEVRPYQIGDDVRTIDWNVTARSDQPYVKLFREERQLSVQLLVDGSGSMDFGSGRQTKREFAAELVGLLALSAVGNGDRVGLTLFSEQVDKHVPLGGSSRHAVRIMRDVLVGQDAVMDRGTSNAAFPAGDNQSGNQRIAGRTNLGRPLEHLAKASHQRVVAFLISDFIDVPLDHELTRALRIAASRHEVIPAIIDDPADQSLPRMGLVRMRDLETGQIVLVDTSNRRVRDQYRRWHENRRQQRDALFRRLKLRPIALRVGDDLVGPLRRYFDG